MITLPIKRVWFDMIISGQKKEEYRNTTSRYIAMFQNAMDENRQFICKLRNGYSKDSPFVIAKVKLSFGTGNPAWGAQIDKIYCILSILELIEIKK